MLRDRMKQITYPMNKCGVYPGGDFLVRDDLHLGRALASRYGLSSWVTASSYAAIGPSRRWEHSGLITIHLFQVRGVEVHLTVWESQAPAPPLAKMLVGLTVISISKYSTPGSRFRGRRRLGDLQDGGEIAGWGV